MTDPSGLGGLRRAADDAMRLLAAEKTKFDEISRVWREESTTVTTRDKSLSMTFDGRGELVDLTFNGSKYRSMPPAQLASLIMETLRRGRAESLEKLLEVAPVPELPGLDFTGIVNGTADPKDVVDKLIEPMLDGLEGVLPTERRERGTGKENHDG